MLFFSHQDLPLQLPGEDAAVHRDHMLLIEFSGSRKVLSTSAYLGGLQEDLSCVYNYDLSCGSKYCSYMLDTSMEGHMRRLGEEAGLPPNHSGLCTAAQIKNTAIVQDTWDGVTVTAFVTAGIDVNACRAGDPASWQEKDGQLGLPLGTINLLLHFSCDLLPGILTGALLTATEAKTAAIQELLLPSRASSGLATGSGTDGAILICNSESPICLTDAGKHSKLGEMIGRTVFFAVKKALFLQTEASPQRLHHISRILGRFGLDEAMLASHFPDRSEEQLSALCQKEEAWTAALVCAHLLDLEAWEVLTHSQALALAQKHFPVEGDSLLEGFLLYYFAEK